MDYTAFNYLIPAIQQTTTIQEVLNLFLEGTKKILPHEECYFLAHQQRGFNLYSQEGLLKESIHINKEQKSILSITMKSHYSMLSNDVKQSLLYNPKIDNVSSHEVENLMMIPSILPHNHTLLGIFIAYSSTPFQKSHLEKMERFMEYFLELFLEHKSNLLEIDHSLFNPNTESLSLCQESIEKLEKKIQISQDFFSTMVHEIRTPMNAVLGFLQLLKEDETDETRRDFIETAISSGDMITLIINDLLDLSKLETGEIDLNTYFFSPLEKLENTAKLFFHTSYKKNITFVTFFDPNIPYLIHSDPYRMKQILNNLLSNAFKFTPEGGTIRLEFLYQEEEDSLLVNVIDSGIGISPKAQKDIFKPYKQASSSTSSQFGGTGLGLAISQQLAVLLGGSLQLESQEGKGSRFFFSIPCNTIKHTPSAIYIPHKQQFQVKLFNLESDNEFFERMKLYFERVNLPYSVVEKEALEELKELPSKAFEVYVLIKTPSSNEHFSLEHHLQGAKKQLLVIETDPLITSPSYPENIKAITLPILPSKLFEAIQSYDPSQQQKASSYAETPKRSQTILIVDDNSINLKLMREILLKLDHTPLLAESGNRALEILKEHPEVTIAFIDQNMPGLSGVETMIEAKKYAPSLKLYGLTGEDDVQTEKAMIDAGAVAVLLKPLDLPKLKKALLD